MRMTLHPNSWTQVAIGERIILLKSQNRLQFHKRMDDSTGNYTYNSGWEPTNKDFSAFSGR